MCISNEDQPFSLTTDTIPVQGALRSDCDLTNLNLKHSFIYVNVDQPSSLTTDAIPVQGALQSDYDLTNLNLKHRFI